MRTVTRFRIGWTALTIALAAAITRATLGQIHADGLMLITITGIITGVLFITTAQDRREQGIR